MFKTRLLSGILLVIIALVTVITGGNLLFAVLVLISLIGMTELYKVFHIEKKAPGIVGYIFAILYYGLLYFKPLLPGESLNWFVMLFMAFLICQMAVLVFAYPKYNTQQIFAGFFGMFYVAVMLSYIYQTRNLPGGIFSVWLVFVCSWGCDTCAYCVGMLIGKHKLAPILSPKKSIEGGIGGILGAALIGVLYGLAINYWGNAAADLLQYAIIGPYTGKVKSRNWKDQQKLKRPMLDKNYFRNRMSNQSQQAEVKVVYSLGNDLYEVWHSLYEYKLKKVVVNGSEIIGTDSSYDAYEKKQKPERPVRGRRGGYER